MPTRRSRAQRKERQPRFDREAWLESAIEVLATEGQAKLRVENLSRELGVSRGSFYHHFKDREDFVDAIVEYWSDVFTETVNAEVEGLDASPSEQLLILMKMIRAERLDRYDIAFRSWAAQDARVAEQVRKVDLSRHALVRSLFEQMGFEGPELDDRVRMWLVYECSKGTVGAPEGVEDDEDFLMRRFEFFTRPSE